MSEVEQRYGSSMMVITRMFKHPGIWQKSWEQELLIDHLDMSSEIVVRYAMNALQVEIDEGGKGYSHIQMKRGNIGGMIE